MTAEKRVNSNLSTTPVDYGDAYYDTYEASEVGPYAWESEHWRGFFMSVADRIVGLLEPSTSLDVGCAKGMLVQALASRGVDARGRDISAYAIETAHADVRNRLTVASATEPIKERYDVITCVEVLEHLSPSDAQDAIDVMCAATDRILFSSTPGDFDETTHINVHPTAQWAAWFAERGFYRRTDADVTFLATWAVLFERADLTKRMIVERYETQFAPLNSEVIEKRRALLEISRRDSDAVRHERELEMEVARLQKRLETARSRVRRVRARLRAKEQEITAIRASRTWRIGRLVIGPLGRLKN